MATDGTLFIEQLTLFIAEIEGLKYLREGDETTDVTINGGTRASYNKYIKSLTDEQFASISALVENVSTFETLAELELVTSPTIVSPATTVGAKVLNDDTEDNNGWYVWDVSASEWVKSPYSSGSSSEIQDVIDGLLINTEEFIGVPENTTLTSGTGITSGTLIFDNPVDDDGVLESFECYLASSGTIKFYVIDKVGDTFTQSYVGYLYPTTAGLKTFTSADFGDIELLKGQYIGVSASNIIAWIDPPAEGDNVYLGSMPTSTSPTLFSGKIVQARFKASSSRYINSSDIIIEEEAYETVSLGNTDKIVITGNSYDDGGGSLKGKAAVNLVSSLSDYNFGNISLGGAGVVEITDLISDDTARHGTSFSKQGATRTIYTDYDNSNSLGSDVFRESLERLINVTRNAGAEPIIFSQHGGSIHTEYSSEQRKMRLCKAVADDMGCLFFDGTSEARTMNENYYAAFFKSNHPATRTNWLIINPMLKLVNSLPRPEKSLKIFRARETVSISSVSDLAFNKISDRHKLFKEIFIGHLALSDSEKIYYDEVTGIYDDNQDVTDEYATLKNGGSISLGEYALIDAIIPVCNPDYLSVTISDTTADVYVLSKNKSEESWVQLSLSDGSFSIPTNYLNYDSVSLLIYKSGGYTQADTPIIKYSGGTSKVGRVRYEKLKASGAEMLTETDVVVSDSIPVSWNNPSSLAPITPVDGVLPKGLVKCVNLGSSYFGQTLTLTESIESRDLLVKVWVRRWVDIFDSASDWTTATINYDTPDTSTLQIIAHGGSDATLSVSASAIAYREVGLHWAEYTFSTSLQAYCDDLTITLYSEDADIQFAYMSVKEIN